MPFRFHCPQIRFSGRPSSSFLASINNSRPHHPQTSLEHRNLIRAGPQFAPTRKKNPPKNHIRNHPDIPFPYSLLYAVTKETMALPDFILLRFSIVTWTPPRKGRLFRGSLSPTHTPGGTATGFASPGRPSIDAPISVRIHFYRHAIRCCL